MLPTDVQKHEWFQHCLFVPNLLVGEKEPEKTLVMDNQSMRGAPWEKQGVKKQTAGLISDLCVSIVETRSPSDVS